MITNKLILVLAIVNQDYVTMTTYNLYSKLEGPSNLLLGSIAHPVVYGGVRSIEIEFRIESTYDLDTN
jgi:hypothetical protein